MSGLSEYTRRAYFTHAHPSPKAEQMAAIVKAERRRRNKAARASRKANRGRA